MTQGPRLSKIKSVACTPYVEQKLILRAGWRQGGGFEGFIPPPSRKEGSSRPGARLRPIDQGCVGAEPTWSGDSNGLKGKGQTDGERIIKLKKDRPKNRSIRVSSPRNQGECRMAQRLLVAGAYGDSNGS
jgi:hypothetical protein